MLQNTFRTECGGISLAISSESKKEKHENLLQHTNSEKTLSLAAQPVAHDVIIAHYTTMKIEEVQQSVKSGFREFLAAWFKLNRKHDERKKLCFHERTRCQRE